MTRVQMFPYLRPVSTRFVATPWKDLSTTTSRPDQEPLSHRDPVLPFLATRTVILDQQGIRQDCMLGNEDRLRLAVIWHSTGTGLRGAGSRIDLEPDETGPQVDLQLQIDGAQISDTIRIETDLVLASTGTGNHRLAPHRAGSLLWRDVQTVQLGDDISFFPTELIDFGTNASWLPSDAGWYLDWDPADLEVPALGRLRLLLNSDHPVIARSVSGSEQSDRAVQDTIRFEVGRTLVMGALDSDDFVAQADTYPDGSIGTALRRLIHALFPTDTLTGLQQYRRQQPFRFECQLQATLRLFHEL